MPHHIIFDHCTFRWATDANVRLRNSNWNLFGSNAGIERIQYITFQWCLFYENFDDVGSIDHSYNFVIGGGCTNITLHHNILGNCRARNPMINGGTVELINNLIFNCPQGIRFGGPVDQSGLEPVYANCIGNWEYHGNDTAANHFCLFSENGSACTDPEDEKLHQIYPLDNRGRYRPGWPLDSEWLVMGCGPGAGNTADERWWVTSPHILVGGRPVTVHTTLTAYNKMIAHAGCTMPLCFGRDGADQAFIQSVKAHGGSIPSSTMAQVSGGGWPALSAGYPTPADPDNDGIWSWFETANGSNPAVADQDDYDYVTAPYRAVYNNIETWANVIDHNPHVVTRVQVN